MSLPVSLRRSEDREWIITPIVLSLLIHFAILCLIIGVGIFSTGKLKDIVETRFSIKEVKRGVTPEVRPDIIEPPKRRVEITPTTRLPTGPVSDIEKGGVIPPPKVTPELEPPKGVFPEYKLPVVARPAPTGTSPEIVAEGIKVPETVGRPLKVTFPVGGGRLIQPLPGPEQLPAIKVSRRDLESSRAEQLARAIPEAPVPSLRVAPSTKAKPELGILVGSALTATPPKRPVVHIPPGPLAELKPLPTVAGKKPLAPYVEVKFSTYKDPQDPHYYFRLEIRARKDNPLPVIPKHVLFVIDVSLSIKVDELQETRKALARFLPRLSKQDSFNVIRFSERIWKLFPEFVPPTEENIAKALEFCDRIPHEKMTDVYSAIQTIVSTIPSGDRPCNVYLVSDGASTMGVKSLRKIVSDFSAVLPPRVSLYVFDAGTGGNLFLLDMLAYKGRGRFTHSDQRIGSSSPLNQLFSKFNEPILVDIVSKYAGLKVDEVYPESIPNLYLGEPIVLYGRCLPGRKAFIYLRGLSATEYHEFKYRVDLKTAETGDSEIARQWAKGKIRHLASLIARFGKRPEWVSQMNHLAEKYKVSIPTYLR